MFKIEDLIIGSANNDGRTSHDGKINDLTHWQTKANKEDERKRGKEKANVFENHFRSGKEENERRMVNNVMQEMRVYDGYLVWLDLT